MTTLAVLPDAFGTHWIRDKCTNCGVRTIFEMFLEDTGFHCKCSCCRESTPFARTVAEARFKARSLNSQIEKLSREYPQLSTLTRAGRSVELPWFIRPEGASHTLAVPASAHGRMPDA